MICTTECIKKKFDILPERYADFKSLTGDAADISIVRNVERLRGNYQLIKLDKDAPLPFRMDELEYDYNGITTNEVLKGIGLR